MEVIQCVQSRKESQKSAAERLGISTRHFRRLVKQYEAIGAPGLVSKRRSMPSPNQLSPDLRQRVCDLIASKYPDFGPTLAHQHLTERHGLKLSRESVRQIMMTSGQWSGKKQRRSKRVHQMRMRSPCFGDLVQIDGSPHDWFEGRAPSCSLIVFVDDATSRLVCLHFAPSETAQAYFDAMEKHLTQYGRPKSYYADKHAIFRVNAKEKQRGHDLTQVGRACKQLDIDLICAHSPQAKGRVERAIGIMQDRLVKAMRLENICSIEQANAYLPSFIEDHNRRFSKPPAYPQDHHRQSLPQADQLKWILSHQHTRTLSKNLELSYQNTCYQIQSRQPCYTMRSSRVTVCERHDEITILYKGRSLDFEIFNKEPSSTTPVLTGKEVIHHVRKRSTYKPPSNHPWRRHWDKPSGSQSS